jgi:hypothetical protein
LLPPFQSSFTIQSKQSPSGESGRRNNHRF